MTSTAFTAARAHHHGGGFAAADLFSAPRRLRGRPSGLKGASHRASRDGLRPPLTPETTAAPGQPTARAGRRACRPGARRSTTTTRSHYRKSLRFQGIAPPEHWDHALPRVLTEITRKINPKRRHRTCPRVVKRAQHNNYRIKRPGETSVHHPGPP